MAASFMANICIRCLATILVCAVANTALAGPITVNQISPQPNYRTATQPWTIGMLHDGLTSNGAIWTKPGALTWQDSGTVLFHADIFDAKDRVSGTVQLHFGCATKSSVGLPSRVDIYGMEGSSLVHLGGISPAAGAVCAGESSWISVPIRYATRKLVIAASASSSFLSLDEIKWDAGNPEPFLTHETVGNSNDAVLKDTKIRLARSLHDSKGASAALTASWKAKFGTSLAAWPVADKYSDLNQFPALDAITQNARCELFGVQDETESTCIGLLNPSTSPKTVSIKIIGDGQQSISINQLSAVLVSGGAQSFDPIVPVKGSITVNPNSASYIWLRVNMAGLKAGVNTFTLKLSSSTGDAVQLPVSITVFPLRTAEAQTPKAILWSYISDKPVFANNPSAALKQITDYGVNVFVVHPGNVPSLDLKNQLTNTAKFSSEVSLYKGRGQVLLFLNLTKALPPNMAKWAEAMGDLMKRLGFDASQWAFYPIDEPGVEGDKVDRLELVAAQIRRGLPSARIYSNPNESVSHKITDANLNRLIKLSTIVQPVLSIAERSPEFQKSARDYWVYSVPPSPTKAANPHRHYRALSWQAWKLGATGVGLWSYSDTTGSSAWDDLDGRRPDFAMAYEDKNGGAPIPSRRLEAFRDGLEDFRMLNLARKTLGAELNKLLCTTFNDSLTVERCRADVLKRLATRR